MADLASLEQALGVTFRKISRLEEALVHSSYVNEYPGLTPASNERLEFLGDAVLGLVVAEKLYQDYPHFDEGEMTGVRAALVRRETLVRIARTISLGDYLYLGKGEEGSGGRDKPANLASALEAVIAAVFLDQGLAKTRDCILRLFDTELAKAIRQGKGMDYKSELQHLAQSSQHSARGGPIYEVIEATGPEHGKTFTVEVRLSKTVLGRGSGKSKKAAENEAARSALEQLQRGFIEGV